MKKHKNKTKKGSDTDSDNPSSEHELSYYMNDRIKLMQEVLKLIKPKKLLAMAPESLKDMQSSEIKSLLLEELLGISNKRLRNILAGENLNYDSSSSSDMDDDDKAEIISLDDITDGSEIYISDDGREFESQKNKSESKKLDNVIVKKELQKKKKKHKKKSTIVKEEPTEPTTEEPVVNILNLLELQARARAIRSQLANEILCDADTPNTEVNMELKKIEDIKKSPKSDEESSSSESVIFINPEKEPVVTIQSNSEGENESDKKSRPKDSNETKMIPQDTTSELQIEEAKLLNERKSPHGNRLSDEDDDVLIVIEDDINLEKDSEKIESNEDNQETTWKTRWLESKKVQDVMKTTKLYNNLRQNRKQKMSAPVETTSEQRNEENQEPTTKGADSQKETVEVTDTENKSAEKSQVENKTAENEKV